MQFYNSSVVNFVNLELYIRVQIEKPCKKFK